MNRMMQLPYQERRKRTDTAETPFGNLKPEHEQWMKNEWKTETHQKQARQLFFKMVFFSMLFLAHFWFHFSEKQNEKWDEKQIKNSNREWHYYNIYMLKFK